MADNIRRVTVSWQGGLLFSAPGPMHQLLLAIASCSGSDVVLILEKMRITLTEFGIDVEGVRRIDDPKRLTAVKLSYRLTGEGLDEAKARRAIDLSIERYCSVIHSLNPDIPISYELAIGGRATAQG